MLRKRNGESLMDYVDRMDADFEKYRKEFIKMIKKAVGMNKKVYFRESSIYDTGMYVNDDFIKINSIDVSKSGVGIAYTTYEYAGDARRNVNGKNKYNNLCVLSMQTYWYIVYAIENLIVEKVDY